MMFNRRKTSQIQVGKVGIGSNFPISVQSMTTTKTRDVDGTLAQIYEIASNGADIVRVTCNEVEAAEGLVEITQRSPVPIIADIHFQYKLALAAIDAGVDGLRLNPGNIRKESQIKEVAKAALSANIPIRIGVNGGSLDKDLLEKYGDATPEALVESAEVDVIKVAEEAQDALNNENIPLQVAVMGCVVNGPGEARSADLGIAAGKNKGHLFIKGEVVRVVNEKEMVDALLSEAKLIIEQGIDARLAAADKNAAEIARKDANDLINSQGDINNFLERKKSVVEISSNTDIEN